MQGFCLLKIQITQFPDGFCLGYTLTLKSYVVNFHMQVSPSQSEERTTYLTQEINDTSSPKSQNDFFFTCDLSCHFSIFKDLKYKAGRRRNVYINRKHMGSAFVRYLCTLCFCIRNLTCLLASLVLFLILRQQLVHIIWTKFPWSILYLLLPCC